MIKKLALIFALALGGCSVAGYTPLYQKVQTGKISVGQVFMTNAGRNQGTRRPAQIVQQELVRFYPEGDGGEFMFEVALTEDFDTLAVRRDATDQRKQLRLNGKVTFYNENRQQVHTTVISKMTPYNVDDKPFSTETSLNSAREVAARAFADEVVRRVALFLGDQRRNGR